MKTVFSASVVCGLGRNPRVYRVNGGGSPLMSSPATHLPLKFTHISPLNITEGVKRLFQKDEHVCKHNKRHQIAGEENQDETIKLTEIQQRRGRGFLKIGRQIDR